MSSLHIEFHSRQHDSHHSGAARVHACLLRVWQYETVQKLEETGGLKTLGETLAQFAYLETVVLETGSSPFDIDKVPSMLESLRNTCGAHVQHRTCDSAHKLALQAKESPSRSTGGGLLSPFWCGHVGAWKNWCVLVSLVSRRLSHRGCSSRLSEEYWDTLKDEDKEAWDPSQPPTATPAARG